MKLLEKAAETLSRKIVTGEREMLAQVYRNRLPQPMHSHESEQMTYVLQGAGSSGRRMKTLREERCSTFRRVEHQSEALEDTFELDVFSPIRRLADHTDDYLRR